MSSADEYLYRSFFRLKVHQSSGDEFQRLFSQVMGYADPRFQPITAWGNWGDGGNDGWIPEDGHYFQVYGPKPTTTDTETAALKKAIDDFDKLPDKWKNVRRYSFVMNDRFQGIPAPIDSALQKLQIDKKLESARGFPMKELLEHFMSLAHDKRQDVVGGIPSSDLSFIDYRAVAELLTALADDAEGKLAFLSETAPDFDEKITLNGLKPPVSSRLEAMSYQISVIDDFLDARDSGLRQAIAQEIRGYYQDSKIAIPDDVEDVANSRYFWLMDKLIPATLTKHPHSLAAYRIAAEIVIAKYFETCEAYEHPDRTTSA